MPTKKKTAPSPPPPPRQTAAEFRALQRLMARAVMRPLTQGLNMRRIWSDGRPTKNVAAGFIKPNDRLTSFQRLEIYNRQYWFRVTDCFYDDYPGLRGVIGERRFANLAVAYVAQRPSTSFTLRNLGRRLVEFIRTQPRWTKPHTAYALDMARLEWAHIEAFDNEARQPLAAKDLAGCDPSKIRLALQPYLTLLKLSWPADNFLIALRDKNRLRAEASNAVETAPTRRSKKTLRLPKPKPVCLAIHRHQNTVFYKRLNSQQYDLLTAIQTGASLEKALQTLPPKSAPKIEDWFQTWSKLGWFFLP